MLKIISIAFLLLVSSLSYSNVYAHPNTGTLVNDDLTIMWNNCDDTDLEYFINVDGTVDLLFNDLFAIENSPKICDMEMVVTVPAGWRPIFSSTFIINYVYIGDIFVSIEYSVGSVTEKISNSVQGEGAALLSVDLNGNDLQCGTDAIIGAKISVDARDSESFVAVVSGTAEILGSHILWEEC